MLVKPALPPRRGFRVAGPMTARIAPVSAVAVPFRHRDLRRTDAPARPDPRAVAVAAARPGAGVPGDAQARALLAATVLARPDPDPDAAAARAAYRSAGRLGRAPAGLLRTVA